MKNKIIVLTSGKGGTGKTTSTINLGAAINHFKKNVLIVDANLSTPNIGVYLNSPEAPLNLNHVLLKKAEPHEAVYEHREGFKVIPASLSIKDLKKIAPEKIKNHKKDFKKLADYILVDSAAGLWHETNSVIKMADELIIVTNPEVASITDALKTIKLAEKYKVPIKGIIMTRVREDKIEMQPDEVKEILEAPVLGMIPEDLTIKKALNLKDAIVHTHPTSKPARAYKEIAASLLGIEYDSRKDRKNFFQRIFSRKD